MPPVLTVIAFSIEMPCGRPGARVLSTRTIAFTLVLVDQDGRAVTDPMGLQIRLQGQVEVGRRGTPVLAWHR